MDENWFSVHAEELGRCLEDARHCADACERLLESMGGGPAAARAIVGALVVPAAISRVLIDLIDQPGFVLGAARLCTDAAQDAIEALGQLDDPRTAEAIAALRTCAASCAALVAA
jgi:hypothetical protein